MTDPRITQIIEALDGTVSSIYMPPEARARGGMGCYMYADQLDTLVAALAAARSLAAEGAAQAAAPAQPTHISVGRAGDSYTVRLTIGVQSFTINGEQESEEHAQWTASMLRKALSNAALPHHQPQASVAHIEVQETGAIEYGLTKDAYKLPPGIHLLYAAPAPSGDTATVDAPKWISTNTLPPRDIDGVWLWDGRNVCWMESAAQFDAGDLFGYSHWMPKIPPLPPSPPLIEKDDRRDGR